MKSTNILKLLKQIVLLSDWKLPFEMLDRRKYLKMYCNVMYLVSTVIEVNVFSNI